MKDSIYFVPIAEDFIDLEHLIHIGKPRFESIGESVSVHLKYMFRKEEVMIGVRAIDLFDAEEAEKFAGYKITKPIFEQIGNAMGEKFKEEAIKMFDWKIRAGIAAAWKKYRESKSPE